MDKIVVIDGVAYKETYRTICPGCGQTEQVLPDEYATCGYCGSPHFLLEKVEDEDNDE